MTLKHGEVAVIDAEDFALISAYRWRLNCDGYAVSHEGTVNPRTVFMHRLINRTPDGQITDHIDQNRLNNRKANLRTATRRTNSLNSGVYATNTSGFRGVSRHGRGWRAAIVIDGRQHHLGNFDSPNEASAVYEAKRCELLVAV